MALLRPQMRALRCSGPSHPRPSSLSTLRDDIAQNRTAFGPLLRKERPARVLYEDAHFLAFRNIKPYAPLAALVIPKRFVLQDPEGLSAKVPLHRPVWHCALLTEPRSALLPVAPALDLAPQGDRRGYCGTRDVGGVSSARLLAKVPHEAAHLCGASASSRCGACEHHRQMGHYCAVLRQPARMRCGRRANEDALGGRRSATKWVVVA